MSGEGSTHLVGCVLTLNEERHVAAVVASLKQVTATVLVVDAGSSDRTKELAAESGAEVLERPFDDYASQRNWAIGQAVERHAPDWIVFLDADERIPSGTAEEIKTLVGSKNGPGAYLIRRKLIFGGKVLRFGGFSRTALVRLFQPGSGRYEDRSVNEHFIPSRGVRVGRLRGSIVHEDITSWERYVEKHNRYSTLEARERHARSANAAPRTKLRDVTRSPFLLRRWMRETLFERSPGKPALRFLYLYVILGGFLDGGPGFRAALFQSWQEMVTEEKFRELQKSDHSGKARVE